MANIFGNLKHYRNLFKFSFLQESKKEIVLLVVMSIDLIIVIYIKKIKYREILD